MTPLEMALLMITVPAVAAVTFMLSASYRLEKAAGGVRETSKAESKLATLIGEDSAYSVRLTDEALDPEGPPRLDPASRRAAQALSEEIFSNVPVRDLLRQQSSEPDGDMHTSEAKPNKQPTLRELAHDVAPYLRRPSRY
ncbi:MAG: hypothetical protein WA880_13350 [Ornithinimicrobium sp.]